MAEKPVAIADRLFRDFLAPLVLGGEMRPGRPIGGKNALGLGPFSDVIDKELLAHVDLARIRLARHLAPIDHVEPPSPAEWALAAGLHDLVQSAHPDLTGVFRGRAPARLVQVVTLTGERIAAPATVGEALARHTWFARALEITRTDTSVSFWVGKRSFLGKDPPSRLLAWPELRRVHIDKTPHPLVELPSAGGHVQPTEFAAGVGAWLRKTPLTDLATCARVAPAFSWSPETLALVSTRAGRTLALRALADVALLDVETALGRATRALLAARAVTPLAVVCALLGERALASAIERAERATPETEPPVEDALVFRAVGAYGASQMLAADASALRPDIARAVRWQLQPWVQSPPGQTTQALLGDAPAVAVGQK
jgi:hypothetical protein